MKKSGSKLKRGIVAMVRKAEQKIYRLNHETAAVVDENFAESQSPTASSASLETGQPADSLSSVDENFTESQSSTASSASLDTGQPADSLSSGTTSAELMTLDAHVAERPKMKKSGNKLKKVIVAIVDKAEKGIYQLSHEKVSVVRVNSAELETLAPETSDRNKEDATGASSKVRSNSAELETLAPETSDRNKEDATGASSKAGRVHMSGNKNVQIHYHFGSSEQATDGSSVKVNAEFAGIKTDGNFTLEGNEDMQLCLTAQSASSGPSTLQNGNTVIKGNKQTQMYCASGIGKESDPGGTVINGNTHSQLGGASSTGKESGAPGNQGNSQINGNTKSQIMLVSSADTGATTQINGNTKSQVMSGPSAAPTAASQINGNTKSQIMTVPPAAPTADTKTASCTTTTSKNMPFKSCDLHHHCCCCRDKHKAEEDGLRLETGTQCSQLSDCPVCSQRLQDNTKKTTQPKTPSTDDSERRKETFPAPNYNAPSVAEPHRERETTRQSSSWWPMVVLGAAAGGAVGLICGGPVGAVAGAKMAADYVAASVVVGTAAAAMVGAVSGAAAR